MKSMKKIAVSALALGVASAAVVFGSMAAWTATTTNPGNSVTTGTLTMTNSKNGAAVINASGIKPGVPGVDTVIITNTGNIPLAATLTQSEVFRNAGPDLKLQIFDGTNCIYPAAVGPCVAYAAWDGSATMNNLALGTFAAAATKTYTVGYRLETTSPDTDQGQANTFKLTWAGAPA